jgi:translation elongation factor aEF-1 beta
MADVLVVVKIMPKNSGTNVDKIAEALKGLKEGKLEKVVKEPIAFGLVALQGYFVIREAEIDKLENGIRKIDGVGTVSVISATRLL